MIPDKALALMEPEARATYRDSLEGEGDTTATQVSIAISLKRIADGIRHLETAVTKAGRGG